MDSDNRAAAVAQILDPRVWADVFEDLWARVCRRFGRVEPRRAGRDLLIGLLSPIERKNSWWLAEHAGHATPDRMQRLVRDVVFDHDGAGADLREFINTHLGHESGVLIADETGFLKKGVHSLGVQRQYTGTAGRIENAQVGVFLTYASPPGPGVARPANLPAGVLVRPAATVRRRRRARRDGLRPQTGAGPRDDLRRPRRRRQRRLGHR